jgi:hypothetical protein
MRRLILALAAIAVFAGVADAQTAIQGFCEVGGTTIKGTGGNTPQDMQASYPGCTVTVFNTGTITPATIFSNSTGTPLANPFTANTTTGQYIFYANNGGYDVMLSGTGFTTYTQYTNVKISNASAGIGGSGTATFIPVFTSSSNVGNSIVQQNVTGKEALIVTQGGGFSGELDLENAGGTNFVGWKAPATLSGTQIWTMPSADGTNGQALITLGNGTTAWATTSCATCITTSGITANQIVIGSGGLTVQGLGSLGTTTTVLHGNAGGPPSFGPVVLTTDISGILPAANGGTGVNNGSNTATFGGAFSTAGAVSFTGANTTTIVTQGTSSVTLPAATDTFALIAATQTFTNKTLASSTDTLGGVTLGLGSDATGDLHYNNGGVLTRLPIGIPGQFLGVSGGVPAWGSPTGSGTVNAGLASDLSYYAVSGTALSDAGTALTWNGTNVLSIGVSNSVTGSVSLANGVAPGITTIQAGAAALSRTIIFPATDPASTNYVLTEAAGVVGGTIQLSWAPNGGSPNAVLNNQANIYSTGNQNFASVSLMLPSGASLQPTANGTIAYDSAAFRVGAGGAGGTTSVYAPFVTPASTDTLTNKTINMAVGGNVFSINSQSITAVSGNTTTLATVNGSTSGQCAQFDANGNIAPSGVGACSGSAGTTVAWNAITTPTGNLNLGMALNTSTFTASGNVTASPLIWQDTTGDTDTTIPLVWFRSQGTSTAPPFEVTAKGTTNGVQVNASGQIVALGTGGVTVASLLGVIATGNLPTTIVYNNQANTYSSGLQDFSSANLTVPNNSGASPTVSARIAYNTTNNNFVGGVNGSDATFAMLQLAESFTAIQTFSDNNIGVTPADIGVVSNTTAAISSLNQFSPNWHFTGTVWDASLASPGSSTVDTTLSEQSTTYSSVVVSSATNATPIVIGTASPTTWLDGETVVITGGTGNTAVNGTWVVQLTNSSTFTLLGSAGNGTYSASSASAAKPAVGWLAIRAQKASGGYTTVGGLTTYGGLFLGGSTPSGHLNVLDTTGPVHFTDSSGGSIYPNIGGASFGPHASVRIDVPSGNVLGQDGLNVNVFGAATGTATNVAAQFQTEAGATGQGMQAINPLVQTAFTNVGGVVAEFDFNNNSGANPPDYPSSFFESGISVVSGGTNNLSAGVLLYRGTGGTWKYGLQLYNFGYAYTGSGVPPSIINAESSTNSLVYGIDARTATFQTNPTNRISAMVAGPYGGTIGTPPNPSSVVALNSAGTADVDLLHLQTIGSTTNILTFGPPTSTTSTSSGIAGGMIFGNVSGVASIGSSNSGTFYFQGNDGVGAGVNTVSVAVNNASSFTRFDGSSSSGFTTVQAGEEIGRFTWRSYDGTSTNPGAQIRGVALNNQSPSDHSMGLYFYTTPSGSTTNTLVMTIAPAGNLIANGTVTNDSATTGQIGEDLNVKVAAGSAVSLSTGAATNITSQSLTAGDWSCGGNVNFSLTSATQVSTSPNEAQIVAGSGGGAFTADGTEVYSGADVSLTGISSKDSITLPQKRVSIASTTTVYLVGAATFTAGSIGGYGSMDCRRLR